MSGVNDHPSGFATGDTRDITANCAANKWVRGQFNYLLYRLFLEGSIYVSHHAHRRCYLSFSCLDTPRSTRLAPRRSIIISNSAFLSLFVSLHITSSSESGPPAFGRHERHFVDTLYSNGQQDTRRLGQPGAIYFQFSPQRRRFLLIRLLFGISRYFFSMHLLAFLVQSSVSDFIALLSSMYFPLVSTTYLARPNPIVNHRGWQ